MSKLDCIKKWNKPPSYMEMAEFRMKHQINSYIIKVTEKFNTDITNVNEIYDNFTKLQTENGPFRGITRMYFLHNFIYNTLNDILSKSEYCHLFDLDEYMFNKCSRRIIGYNSKCTDNICDSIDIDIIHIEI